MESGFIRPFVLEEPVEPESEIVNPHTVLIISDDAAFSRQLSHCWQKQRAVPAFTTLRSDLAHDFDADAFDLAIVAAMGKEASKRVWKELDRSGNPVIALLPVGQTAEFAPSEFLRILTLPQHEGWVDAVVLLAAEVLRRAEAVRRAERAEHINALLKCHATLGQYVIDMRHTMNNALTSVLGNAELLLLEPGMFSASVRAQIDTIRNMALRLHEILQRFSSLEKELTFAERQAVKESRIHAPAVGQ
jgi:signal transduction histidine kinase